MSAVLVFRPGQGAGVTAGTILAHAAQRGVVPDEDVERRIADVLEGFEPGPMPFEAVIAEGRPPRHGADMHVRWEPGLVPKSVLTALPDVGDEHDAAEGAADAGDDGEGGGEGDGSVDHYAGGDLRTVEVGEAVGRIRRPTDGVPGRTVTGEELPARDGRDMTLELDEATLEIAEGGVVRARAAGRVAVDAVRAWIDPVLEISNDVDFSTGNVDFGGALLIRGGVKDRFTVRCTGDTSIGGLIESATLLIGGDLYCHSGMAAKERGMLVVDGDCEVSYLNQARGRIRGTLTCRRELIESELVVGGDLLVDRGAIVGGTSVVTGRVRASVFGSGAGAPTRLVLGEVPLETRAVRRLREMARELEREIASEDARIESLAASGVPDDELEELRAAQRGRRLRHEAMQRKDLELLRRIKHGRRICLRIERRIHHRAIVGVRGREYEFEEDQRGPIEILADDRGEPVVRVRGADPRPLLDLTRLVQRAVAA